MNRWDIKIGGHRIGRTYATKVEATTALLCAMWSFGFDDTMVTYKEIYDNSCISMNGVLYEVVEVKR